MPALRFRTAGAADVGYLSGQVNTEFHHNFKSLERFKKPLA
jgi:hypothetical protein